MRMLVQSVVSLAFLCATPHFLSAQLVPRSANAWAYFSHIADGGGWQTTFTVSNPNWNPVSGRILFKDSEGQDLYLDLEGYDPSGSVEFEIPAFGAVEFTSSATGTGVRVDGPRFTHPIQFRAWRPTALWKTEALDIRSAFTVPSTNGWTTSTTT